MKFRRSTHTSIVLVASLVVAMTVIQYLPTADGQMTISEGIKATYVDRSGGRKRKKKKSGSESSTSRSDSDSSSSKNKSSRKKEKSRSSSKRNKDDSKNKSKDKKSRSKNRSESKLANKSRTSRLKSKSKSSDKVSTWQYLNATSGASGFDNDEKDFDILRELIVTVNFDELLVGPDDGGLDLITFFAPWDLAFAKLADRLGYEGDYDGESRVRKAVQCSRKIFCICMHVTMNDFLRRCLHWLCSRLLQNSTSLIFPFFLSFTCMHGTPFRLLEEAIFSFLATAIAGYAEANGSTLVEAIKDILRYHIGEPQRTDERLRDKGSITTTYKNLNLGVEVDKKKDRTVLLDESRANPKIHDKLKDIKTTNGYLHYTKSVLVPYGDIYGDGGPSSSSSSSSGSGSRDSDDGS